MNPRIEEFLENGCGRCDYYKTAKCKVIQWQSELSFLRTIILECGLSEEVKWSQPCYTDRGKNIILLSAFKDYAFISFFKGSLLSDKAKILYAPGQHSQADRRLEFRSIDEIEARKELIQQYIYEAIELERADIKVVFNKSSEPIPDELTDKFISDPEFKKSFNALTPGRQRGYLLFFNRAKQVSTRIRRIDKHYDDIMSGKGLHD